MAKNQKNQGFAAIRDVVSSSRFRESRIQVYNDNVLAANISFNHKEPFLKMEQRENKSITLFLERQDDEGFIDYSCGCKLMENEPIINLYKKFSEHPKIERVLIALLELH